MEPCQRGFAISEPFAALFPGRGEGTDPGQFPGRMPRVEAIRVKSPGTFLFALVVVLTFPFWTGCGTTFRTRAERERAASIPSARVGGVALSRESEERILALDSNRVSARDVSEVLSSVPAPQLLNIHGGIFPVYRCMKSYARFLIGMGYPPASISNAVTGDYSFSCYDDSARIAGAVAWYYERDGLRPMMIGHSQGGMQAVKVLHELTGVRGARLRVWNPHTGRFEQRTQILDPLTGRLLPTADVRVAYAAAVGSGGLTRLMPTQWDMLGRLRKVPNSVVEFSGYQIPLDVLGGDLLGFTALNDYHAVGGAAVHNLRLPFGENHVIVPSTRHLLDKPELVEWMHEYHPDEPRKATPKTGGNQRHLLFAADTWYHLKKHWVLELQRLIRARRGEPDSP